MKKLVFIYVILALNFSPLFAQQADSLSAFIAKANGYYKQTKYDSALIFYNKVLNAGYTAPELYYNLGNTYFRLGDIARAILYYEKAYRLNPSDEKIRHNLEYANQFVQDDFPDVKVFFLKRWWKNLALSLRADAWAYISIGLFVLALALLFVFWFAKKISVRKAAFFSAIIAMVISLLTLSLSLENKHYVLNSGEAIVIAQSSVRSSPSLQGTELFILHPGTKVKILSKNDGWYEVKLPNGSIGWMKKDDLEKI